MSKIKNVLARAISLASEQPMSYNEVESLLEDIDTCKVKIWLEEGAILPKYAHKEDACVCRRVDCYDEPSYSVGDKVAQLLIRRRERIVWDQVKSLDDLGYTDRGDGGFGSTGR